MKKSNQVRMDLHTAKVQFQQRGRGAGKQVLSTRDDFRSQGASLVYPVAGG
jgi:hypothetical protein